METLLIKRFKRDRQRYRETKRQRDSSTWCGMNLNRRITFREIERQRDRDRETEIERQLQRDRETKRQ